MKKFDPERRSFSVPARVDSHGIAHGEPVFGYGEAPREEDGSLDPLKLIGYVIGYRWLIAAFLFTGLAVGTIYTYMQTPLYRATTKVEVVSPTAKVIQDLEIVTQSGLETVRQKLQSRDFARRVVFSLGLADDPRFLAPTPHFSLMNIINRAFDRTPAVDIAELTAEQREGMAIGRVRGGLSTSLVRDTSILNVSFSHADPEYAARVANQIVRSFVDQTVDTTTETSDLAREFIEDQVRETKAKLANAERALLAYTKEAGILLTGREGSLIADQIQAMNEELSEAMKERLAAETYVEQVKAGDAGNIPAVIQSESIRDARSEINALKITYQTKLTTLKPGFPEMQRLQLQISELEDQIKAEIGAIAQLAQIQYAQAQERVARITREIEGLEEEQRAYQDKSIQYNILNREVESYRSQYDSLISKLNEIGIGSNLQTTRASIIDEATRPWAPYSPSLKKNLAMFLAAFAALAAGVIFLLELMRNSFTIPDQIEEELKIPVLGVLPMIDEKDLDEAMADPKSGLSEAYRSLRTSLQFTGIGDSLKTLIVTSAEQSEGKSTTVYKLTQDFAALGRRVLVVDADMRRPNLHRLFNISNAAGLSNILSNVLRRGDVATILHKTDHPLVTVLSAGTIPPNPVELLMSQKMSLVIAHMAKAYDIVLIDCPPIMGLADAPVLSRMADATLLVVSAKQVSRKSAKSALERLRAASGNVVGGALTKFSVDKFDYAYSYRYNHYYSYYGYDHASVEIANGTARDEASDLKGKLARGRSDLLARLKRNRD